LISRGFSRQIAVAALALLVQPVAAHAGPHSEIASAFDEGDEFDLHVTIDYALDVRSGTVQREVVGAAGTAPTDPLPLVDDLTYSSTRHTLTPRVELGLFHDLSLGLALPIVIRDSRELALDGIAADASSTVADGLLPMTGFDADDPSGPGFTNPTDSTIFRGPTRAGLDQVHLALAWAPMNQEKDDTKPTWKLIASLGLPIGTEMELDRMDPDSSTGVGRGLWEVTLKTTVAKQLSWAEPFVELWWTAPFNETEDSAFTDLGFGSRRASAQQNAGTRFGFEAYALNKPEEHQRISLELSALFQANFEGRAYTEMWEVFSYAGDARASGPLVLDEDPVTAGQQAYSHPGVSNVENYLTFGGRAGIRAQIGEKVRFGAAFGLYHDQSHIISFADAGTDKPTCRGGATPPACEASSNDVVDPGTDEVNPHYAPTIDLVGHRYRLDGATDYMLLVDARVLF
jgi:hypothetical protein